MDNRHSGKTNIDKKESSLSQGDSSMPSVAQERTEGPINNLKSNQGNTVNQKNGMSSTTTTAATTFTSGANGLRKDEPKEPVKEKKTKDKKNQKEQHLYFCTTKCRYVVVKKACRQLGFKMMDDENGDWDIHWNDTAGVTPEQLAKIQPY